MKVASCAPQRQLSSAALASKASARTISSCSVAVVIEEDDNESEEENDESVFLKMPARRWRARIARWRTISPSVPLGLCSCTSHLGRIHAAHVAAEGFIFLHTMLTVFLSHIPCRLVCIGTLRKHARDDCCKSFEWVRREQACRGTNIDNRCPHESFGVC